MAVVLVHLMAVFPGTIYTAYSWSTLAVAFQVLVRFSVPLFLALSGYGLARKYARQTFSWSEFLGRRLGKLLPLYFLWSGVHFVSFYLVPQWRIMSVYPLGETLLWGLADYQLYFVPLILQFYLLFPWLNRLSKKSLLLTLGLSILLQIAVIVSLRQSFSDPHWLGISWPSWWTADQMQYRFGFNWLAYFVLGVLLGKYSWRPAWSHWLKIFAMAGMGLGLIWGVANATRLIRATGNITYATGFLHLPILLFSLGIIGLFLSDESMWRKLPAKLSSWFNNLGRDSYLIFLSHTLVLRLLFSALQGNVSWLIWLSLAGLFAGSWYVSQRLS